MPIEEPVLVGEEDAVLGAVIAIQSFGDFLQFHPHLHALCSDGCFYGEGMFRVAPRFETKQLEEVFRHKVFKMLLSKSKITQDLVNPASAGENLARYIIRASFSQERMTYIAEDSKVVYKSKDGREEKIFDALEWIAAMCSHIPNKGEQMVRYYGSYSNVAQGKRTKKGQYVLIDSILEPDGSSREYKRNWARLIQRFTK